MSEATAIIVMATLNGAKWIREQVESIKRQSVADWLLLISDDGSTDATRDIILEYSTVDERIELLPARTGKEGHVANFEYLLGEARQRGSRYIFLCDQDDVWEPDKLSRFLASVSNSASGALWYSDLQMLDDRKLAEPSYFAWMGYPRAVSTRLLLSQSTIPGCAMMLGRDLLELALPFPEGLQNHDWWLALCASVNGGITLVDEPLVHYRQHDENTIGADISIARVGQLPRIFARQNRVWASKVGAIQELLNRSGGLDDSSSSALQEWLRAFDGTPFHIAAKELAFGQFRPISRSLLILQLFALFFRSR